MRRNITLMLVGILVLTATTYHYNAVGTSKRILSTQTGPEAEKLLSVYVLARHGARTPYYAPSSIEQANYTLDLVEPYVFAAKSLRELNGSEFKHGVGAQDKSAYANKLKGGAGRGRLTKVGEKQLFDLGLRLREKYIKKLNFIADKYDHNEMFVRSTHYLRTIHSAKSFLAGFYGMNPKDSNNEPFTIFLKNHDDDNLFLNRGRCKFLNSKRDKQYKEKLYMNEKFISGLDELYNALRITKDLKHPISFTGFHDDLAARKALGLSIPDNLKSLLQLCDKYAAMELSVHVFGEDPRLACGPLLNEFKEGLINVIKNDSVNRNDFHKFNYYSNHDQTIMAVLLALGLVDDNSWHWPPFASTVTFELWRDYSVQSSSTDYYGYFIRVFYCEKPVELPGCSGGSGGDSTKCNMNDFLKILSKYSTTLLEYEAICSRPY